MARPVRVLELRSVSGTGGGPDKTILNGAATSDRSRVAVTVCYLRNADDAAFSLHERAERLGVDYIEIRERRAFDLAVWRRLRRLVLDTRIDIVHGHDYKTNLLALCLSRVTPALPVTTAHNWSGDSWKERCVYYPADKRLARFFPAVIAVSPQVRDELVRHGTPAARITTLANGIDHVACRRSPGQESAVRQSLGLAADDTVVGSVGRLEPEKRFDLLVTAFARIACEMPSLRLVIAGEGAERPRLEQLARTLGVADRCRLVGHRHDIVRLHHAFDLYVQSSDIEGSPNAVLEAMAMETAVVATDAGGTRELITPNVHGLIVPAGDATALAEAMRNALSCGDETAARVRHARRRVEDALSFDVRTRRLNDIYAALMNTRHDAPAAPDLASQRT